MSTLYKDLLFFHGYVTNPYVLQPKAPPAPQPEEPATAAPIVAEDPGSAVAARRRSDADLRKCA